MISQWGKHSCGDYIRISYLLLTIGVFSSSVIVSAYIRGNDWKDLLLTGEEKRVLDLFKAKVFYQQIPEKFMKSDFYLLRWIRVSNLDIVKAQEKFFENLEWRERNNISVILEEDWSDMQQDFHVSLESHDKQGRPEIGKLSRLLRYMDCFQESLLRQILTAQDNGKNVTRATVIVDVEGVNLLQHLCSACLSVFLRMTQGMESHYPGFWEEIVVINAPVVSKVGLQAIRPVMSKETRNILRLFDSNKQQWTSYLDERISRDQRTSNYG